MKQLLLSLALALICVTAVQGQPPKSFSYQAVVRDNNGKPLPQIQPVSFRFSIQQNSPSGPVVYGETQATNPNQFGLVNLSIGAGTVYTGNFSTINWGAGPYYLRVELDAAGGTNYTNMGTSQLLSVPYALYAESSATPAPQGSKDNWSDYMIIEEQRARGTDGGYATQGWNVRQLNKVVDSAGTAIHFNPSSSSITLSDSGKYYIYANAVGYAASGHKLALRNVITGIVVMNGTSDFSSSSYGSPRSWLDGTITISGPTTIRLEHWFNVTSNLYNLGNSASTLSPPLEEVYSHIRIQKIR